MDDAKDIRKPHDSDDDVSTLAHITTNDCVAFDPHVSQNKLRCRNVDMQHLSMVSMSD